MKKRVLFVVLWFVLSFTIGMVLSSNYINANFTDNPFVDVNDSIFLTENISGTINLSNDSLDNLSNTSLDELIELNSTNITENFVIELMENAIIEDISTILNNQTIEDIFDNNITNYTSSNITTNVSVINISIIEISTAVIINESFSYSPVKLNSRVRWLKNITVNGTGTLDVKIPLDATIIDVVSSKKDNVIDASKKGVKSVDASKKGVKSVDASIHSIVENKKIKYISEFDTIIIQNITTDNNTLTNFVIEYETLGPVSIVSDLSLNKKMLNVYSENHFVDVEASIDIVESKANSAVLFWVEENTYLNYTNVDSNGDGLVDRLDFIIPHLSNQTFIVSLDVLNVQSYPVLYGNWKVEFATSGTRDLYVYALNTTFIGVNSSYVDGNGSSLNSDLEFVELRCGENIIPMVPVLDGFLALNFSCDTNAYFISKELRVGEHHLQLVFGDEVAYAHNYAVDALKFISRRIVGLGSYVFKFLSTDAITDLSINITGLSVGTTNHSVVCSESSNNYWICLWNNYGLGNYLISTFATPTDELNTTINVTSNSITAYLESLNGLTYVRGSSLGTTDAVVISINNVNVTRDYSPIFNDTFFNLTVLTRENLTLVLEYNSTTGFNKSIFNLSSDFINPSSSPQWYEAEDLSSSSSCTIESTSCNDSNCVKFCTNDADGYVDFTVSAPSQTYAWIKTAVSDYAAYNVPYFYSSYYNGTDWSTESSVPIGTLAGDDGTIFEWDRINVSNAEILRLRINIEDGLGNEYLYVDKIVFTNDSTYNPVTHGVYPTNTFSVMINGSGDVWQQSSFNSTLIGTISDYTAPFRITGARVSSLISNSTGGFSYGMNISGSNNITIKAYYGDSYAQKNFSVINGVVLDTTIFDSYLQSDYVVGLNESFNITIVATILGSSISNVTVSLNDVNYTTTFVSGEYKRTLTAPNVVGDYNLSYNIYVDSILNSTYNYVLRVRNLTISASAIGFNNLFVQNSVYGLIGNVSDGYDNSRIGSVTIGSDIVSFNNNYTTYYSSDGVSWNVLDDGSYSDVYLKFDLNGTGASSPIIDSVNTGYSIIDFNDSSEFNLSGTEIKNGRLQLIGALWYNDTIGNTSLSNLSFGSDRINRYYGSLMFDVDIFGSGTLFKLYYDSNNYWNFTTNSTSVLFNYMGSGVLSSGYCSGDGVYVINYGVGVLNVTRNGVSCLDLLYTEMNNSVKSNITLGGNIVFNKVGFYSSNLLNNISRYATSGYAVSNSVYDINNYSVIAYNFGNSFYLDRIASGLGVQSISVNGSSSYGLNRFFNYSYTSTPDIYSPTYYNYRISDSMPTRFSIVYVDSELFDHSGLLNASLYLNSGSGFSVYKTVVLDGVYDYVRFGVNTSVYSKDTTVQYYVKFFDNASVLMGQTTTRSFTVQSPYRVTLSLWFNSLLDSIDQFISGMFTRLGTVQLDMLYPNALMLVDGQNFSNVNYFRADNVLTLDVKKYYVYDNFSGVKEELIQLDAGLVPDVNSGLMAYWPFELSNATRDASGNNNNLNVTSPITSPALTDDCSKGYCYKLDGVNDAFAVSNSMISNYVVNNSFTWSLWLKGNGTSNPSHTYGLFGYSSHGWPRLGFGLFYNQWKFILDNNTILCGYTNVSRYVNILVTVDSNGYISCYNDGVFTGRSNYIPGIISREWYLGYGYSPPTHIAYFNGSFDDIRIYNTALNYSDVQRIYSGSRSGRYTSPIYTVPYGNNLTLNNLTLIVNDIGNSTVLVQSRFSNDNITWSSWYPAVNNDNRISDTIFYQNFDSSSSLNNPYCSGTCNVINSSISGMNYTTGIVSNASYFNGNSYISYNNSFITNKTSGTIEFWINPNATTNVTTQGILDTGTGVNIYSGKAQITNGLISYWPLDNYYLSPNRVGSGPFGNSLYFNRTSSTYVDVGNSSLTDFGTENFSVSLWVKTAGNFSTWATEVGRGDVIGSSAAWGVISSNNNSIRLRVKNSTTVEEVGALILVNTWTHVVFLRYGNETNDYLEAYVNGVKYGSTVNYSSKIDASTSNNLKIGVWLLYYDGYMDEIRLFNRTLNLSEIISLNSSNTIADTTGLVAHYAFEESNTSLVANDSSGNALHGNLTNYLSRTPDVVGNNNGLCYYMNNGLVYDNCGFTSGYYNNSVPFDGANDFIGFSAMGINGSSSRTLSVWVKTNNQSGRQTILGWGGASQNASFILEFNVASMGCTASDGKLFFVGYLNDICTPFVVSNNQWNHVVATYDGTTVFIYANGNLVANKTITLNTSDTSLTIGREGYSALYKLNGSVDDVMIFNRSLSLAEIQNLYSSGAHFSCWNGTNNIHPVSNFSMSPNQYSHLSFTYTNQSSQAYLNGELVASSSTGCIANLTNGTFNIGRVNVTGNYSYFDGSFDSLRISDRVLERFELSYWTGSNVTSMQLPYSLSTNLSNYFQYRVILRKNNATSSTALSSASFYYTNNSQYESTGYVESRTLEFNDLFSFGNLFFTKSDVANVTEANVQFRTGTNTSGNITWSSWSAGVPKNTPGTLLLETFESTLIGNATDYTNETGYNGQGIGLGYRNFGILSQGGNFSTSDIYAKGTGAFIGGNHNYDYTDAKSVLNLNFDDATYPESTGNYYSMNLTNVSIQNGVATFNENSSITIISPQVEELTNDFAISIRYNTSSNEHQELFSETAKTTQDNSGVKIRLMPNGTPYVKLVTNDYVVAPAGIYGDGTYLYFVDYETSRLITLWMNNLSFKSRVGTTGTGNNDFRRPSGVWTDGNYIYTTEVFNDRIVKRLASDMSYISQYGSGGSGDNQLADPMDIWGDATYIYITDRGNNRIVKRYANNLSYVSTVGSTGSGDEQYNGIYGIWGDGTYIYTTEYYNNRIIKRYANNLTFVNKSTYGFSQPRGICGDGTYLYVADSANNRVVKLYASNLSFVATNGSLGSGNDNFNIPNGIYCNGTHVFITDAYNYRVVIRKMSDLSYVSQFGYLGLEKGNAGIVNAVNNYTQGFYTPEYVLRDNNYLIITDSSNNRVVMRNPYTLDYAGLFGSGFNSPGVIFNDGTYIFVSNSLNHSIRKYYASNYSFISQVGTLGNGTDQFNLSYGIWGDGTYIYITDYNNHRIVKRYVSNLSYVSEYGSYGTSNTSFNSPSAIIGDGTYLYIADTFNDRIIKIYANNLSYVDKYGSGGSTDNLLNDPRGLFIDGNYLYIMDSQNNRIMVRYLNNWSYVNKLDNGLGLRNDQFYYPRGIIADNKYLYIADTSSQRVKIHKKSDLSYVDETYSSINCISPSNFTSGDFHNLLMTVTNGNLSFYVDGIQVCTAYLNNGLYPSVRASSLLEIGKYYGFTGQIDSINVLKLNSQSNLTRLASNLNNSYAFNPEVNSFYNPVAYYRQLNQTRLVNRVKTTFPNDSSQYYSIYTSNVTSPVPLLPITLDKRSIIINSSDNNWIKYYTSGNIFNNPKTYGTQLTQDEYYQAKKLDNLAYTITIPTDGYRTALYIAFNLTGYNLSQFSSIRLKAYAHGSGWNGAAESFGLNISVWNNTGSAWVSLVNTSYNSSALTIGSITSGFGNYTDANNTLFMMVTSSYPANTLNTVTSKLAVDYVALDLVPSATLIASQWTIAVDNRTSYGETIDSFTPRQSLWVATVMKTSLTNWDFSEYSSNTGRADSWLQSSYANATYSWDSGVQRSYFNGVASWQSYIRQPVNWLTPNQYFVEVRSRSDNGSIIRTGTSDGQFGGIINSGTNWTTYSLIMSMLTPTYIFGSYFQIFPTTASWMDLDYVKLFPIPLNTNFTTLSTTIYNQEIFDAGQLSYNTATYLNSTVGTIEYVTKSGITPINYLNSAISILHFDDLNYLHNATVIDSSNRHLNGLVNGSNTASTTGYLGNGIEFSTNSSGSLVSTIQISNITSSRTGITFAGWIKPKGNTNLTNFSSIFTTGNTLGAEVFQLYTINNNTNYDLIVRYGYSTHNPPTHESYFECNISSFFVGSTWVHVVAMTNYEDKKVYIYKNGIFIKNCSISRINQVILTNGFIGNDANNSNPFNGTMDEIYIFNKSLSDIEVKALYSRNNFAQNNNTKLINSLPNSNVNEWHHYALTYNNSIPQFSIWEDGVITETVNTIFNTTNIATLIFENKEFQSNLILDNLHISNYPKTQYELDYYQGIDTNTSITNTNLIASSQSMSEGNAIQYRIISRSKSLTQTPTVSSISWNIFKNLNANISCGPFCYLYNFTLNLPEQSPIGIYNLNAIGISTDENATNATSFTLIRIINTTILDSPTPSKYYAGNNLNISFQIYDQYNHPIAETTPNITVFTSSSASARLQFPSYTWNTTTITIPIGSNITLYNDLPDTWVFTSDLSNNSIDTTSSATFYADTAGIHTLSVSRLGTTLSSTLTINVTTSNEISCTNTTIFDNGIIQCILDTFSIPTPYNYNLKINLSKNYYQGYQKVYHDAFTLYSKDGILGMTLPTEIINGSTNYNFNTTLTIINTGGTAITDLIVFNTASQGFNITLLNNTCTNLEIYENCTTTYNMIIPQLANIQDYTLYWRANFTDYQGRKTSAQFDQIISILQNPSIALNVTSININQTHNSLSTISLLLNTSGNVDLTNINITYIGDLNITFNPSTFTNTYKTSPETFIATINIPYRQYAGLYVGYINITGLSANLPYPQASLTIPINITVLTDHNYTITPLSVDLEHQLSIPGIIASYNITNYGNINESLTFNISQVGTDYDDVKNTSNIATGSIVSVPINSILTINLSHKAYASPRIFYFNISVGNVNSTVRLNIKDMPPILGTPNIINPPIELGVQSRIAFTISDEQPGSLNNTCTYNNGGNINVVIAQQYLGSYSCFFTPSIEGIYNVTILSIDNGLQNSTATLNFTSIGYTTISSTQISVPHAYNIGLNIEENISIPLTITNIGNASALDLNITTISEYSAYIQNITILRNQSNNTNITLTVPAGKLPGNYIIPMNITWINRDSTIGIKAINASIIVNDNPMMQISGLPTDINIQHGTSQNYTINISSVGNADLADIILSDVTTSTFNITFYETSGSQSHYISVIPKGTTTQMIMTVSATPGAYGSGLTASINISSNADESISNINIYIPQNFSYRTINNLTIIDTYNQNRTTIIQINNTGNINKIFTFDIINLTNTTVNTTLTINKQTSGYLTLNYLTPETDVNMSGYIGINYTSGYDLIPLTIRTIPASFNITSISHSSINKLRDIIFNFTANISINNVITTNNLTFTAAFSNYDCTIISEAFSNQTGLWDVSCNVPSNVIDGMNHTLTVSALDSTSGILLTDTSQTIFFVDTTSPVITNTTTGIQSDGLFLEVGVTATDNVGIITATAYIPYTNETFILTNIGNYYYTQVVENELRDYNIIYTLTDEQNNSINYTSTFGIYRRKAFSGTLKDYTNTAFITSFQFYEPITQTYTSFSTNVNGYYSQNLYAKSYYLIIKTRNYTLILNNASLLNATSIIVLDEIPKNLIPLTSIVTGSKGLIVETNLSASGSIIVNYSSLTINNEPYLEVFKCSNWNKVAYSCDDAWWSQLPKSKDVINRLVTATISDSYTATANIYALVENIPAPAPILELVDSTPTYTLNSEDSSLVQNLSLYINSAGEEGLRNVVITCTSSICSTLGFVSETKNSINPLTPNVPIRFTVTLPRGYAAGNYTTPITIESNANPVSAILTFIVPESTLVNITPTNNIYLETGTGIIGTLVTLNVAHQGNKDVTLSHNATHNFITFPSNMELNVLETNTIPITYNIPNQKGTYIGQINIGNQNINYTINVTSNVTINTIFPDNNLLAGDTIRIEFEANNKSVALTNSTLLQSDINITINNQECIISPISPLEYTTYFTVRCQIPNIGLDVANYTLRLSTPFAASELPVYYVDIFGPSVSYVDSSSERSNDTYINFTLYDSTGIGSVSATIISENGTLSIPDTVSDINTPLTNVIIMLGNNSYILKTDITTIGDYDISFITKDINNFETITTIPYEIYEYCNLSGDIRDMSNNYIPALFKFYNPTTELLVSTIQHSGTYSTNTMHKREYSMYIESFDEAAKIWLDSVDLRSNLSDLMDMSELDLSKVGVIYTLGNTLDIYGIAVSTNISSSGNLSLIFNPSDYSITNTQNIQMFKCSDFNYALGICNSNFTEQNSTKTYNLDGTQTVTTQITGFSAYLLTELKPEGSVSTSTTTIVSSSSGGGGGGGGGSDFSAALDSLTSSLDSAKNTSKILVDADEIKREMYIGERTTAKIRLTNPLSESNNITLSVSEELSQFLNLSKTTVTLGPKEETVIEIDIFADFETKKGLYSGTVQIKSAQGSKNLPVELRIYESSEFSTTINVELLNPRITPGNPIRAQFDINYPSSIPTNFSYTIEAYDSFKEEKIYSEEGYLYVTGPTNLFKEISTDKNTKLGEYVLKITLSEKTRKLDYKKTATFEIITPFLERKLLSLKILYYLYIIGIIAGILGLIFAYRGLKAYIESKKRYHLVVDRNELPQPGNNSIFVGNLAETSTRTFFELSQLRTHTIIAGTTGGGKSVTAQVFIEEALDKNVGVIVFDPTAQWSGFLRKLNSKQMMELYAQFGMKSTDAKAFNGNVYNIEDPLEIIDIKKHIQPGEIHVFTTQRLTPAQMDIFVANTVRQVFTEGFDETPNLRGLIVYDEVHRLLPKFGGSGEGFIQIERACREFRKWGLGVVLISQVLSDFVGEIKANITTEVQMRTRDDGDLERLKVKYGEELQQALVKTVAGTGMLENPSYNKGRPYLITFRPLKHSIERLSEADLVMYNKYNNILDEFEYQLDQLKVLEYDTFDLELEYKLAMQKVKSGQFNMVDIYLESLEPSFTAAWKSVGKTPKKKVKKLADIKEVKKAVLEAQKAHDKALKDEKKQETQKVDSDNTNNTTETSNNTTITNSENDSALGKGFKEGLIDNSITPSKIISSSENKSIPIAKDKIEIKNTPMDNSTVSVKTQNSYKKLKNLNIKMEEAKSKKDMTKIRKIFIDMKEIIETLPLTDQKRYATFVESYDRLFKITHEETKKTIKRK